MHTHTPSLMHTLSKNQHNQAFHNSTQRAMEFLFSFNISQYSYTTPPFLFDKSNERKEVHLLVATKIGQLGAGKWIFNQLEAAVGGPPLNPSVNLGLFSHTPLC